MSITVRWTAPGDAPVATRSPLPAEWWGVTLAAWRSQRTPEVEVLLQGDPAGAYGVLMCHRCHARHEWVSPLPLSVKDMSRIAAGAATAALAIQADWEVHHATCRAPVSEPDMAVHTMAWRALRHSPPGTTVALLHAAEGPSRHGVAVPFDYLADPAAAGLSAQRGRAAAVRRAAARMGATVDVVAQVLVHCESGDESAGDAADWPTRVLVLRRSGLWWSDRAGTSPVWHRMQIAVPRADGYLAGPLTADERQRPPDAAW